MVIARRAAGAAGGERLADVVETLQRARADRVDDAVTVRLDRAGCLDFAVEAVEGRAWPLLVREVGERLLEAPPLGVAILNLRVVRLERGRYRATATGSACRPDDEVGDILDLLFTELVRRPASRRRPLSPAGRLRRGVMVHLIEVWPHRARAPGRGEGMDNRRSRHPRRPSCRPRSTSGRRSRLSPRPRRHPAGGWSRRAG